MKTMYLVRDKKNYFLEGIDKLIGEEIDEEYYEQVRSFTDDFKFLKESSEVMNAINGHSNKRKKFSDPIQYNRFCNLRNLVKKEYDEYEQISNLLKDDSVSSVDKKILEARKAVMDREKEEKNIGLR